MSSSSLVLPLDFSQPSPPPGTLDDRTERLGRPVDPGLVTYGDTSDDSLGTNQSSSEDGGSEDIGGDAQSEDQSPSPSLRPQPIDQSDPSFANWAREDTERVFGDTKEAERLGFMKQRATFYDSDDEDHERPYEGIILSTVDMTLHWYKGNEFKSFIGSGEDCHRDAWVSGDPCRIVEDSDDGPSTLSGSDEAEEAVSHGQVDSGRSRTMVSNDPIAQQSQSSSKVADWLESAIR